MINNRVLEKLKKQLNQLNKTIEEEREKNNKEYWKLTTYTDNTKKNIVLILKFNKLVDIARALGFTKTTDLSTFIYKKNINNNRLNKIYSVIDIKKVKIDENNEESEEEKKEKKRLINCC